MAISQPPFQSTLVDADDRVQTPWAQWFSQLQPLLQAVVASGPTSGRPTQNLFIGYPYFDTTIDQMVYWNGVIWVTYAPSTTGTSILKGNGSGGFNNAVAGVDFAPATSGNAILYGNGSGGFSSVAIGSGVTFAGGVLSATGSGGTVTAVTGTAPIASSGGTAPAISISQAGTATDGYLTSIDWNTFNNKGLGTVTAVTGSGNIASSGGTTPNITFTGTLPIANGGTNGTATPTAGAVAVGNGTQYAFTAAGSAGQVLTSNGSTVPTWATVATGIGTTGYWGSFWDTTNQTAASTTVAYTINIGTSDPNNNGVSIVSSNQITVAYAGVYNIQYSIQFENIGTGNKNYNVDVWFRLNGVDIPDSNSTYWIASKNSTVNGELIAAVNYVLSLAAGDYIQLMWAVSDVDISIATISATSSPTVPRTPGVIVTVTPITEVGIGYYNLTSVSSVAIATGAQTFTTNLSNISTAFTVGTRIRVAYVTTPANYMEGVITSFSGTALVVNVDSIGGSGTFASWTISVAGIQGSNGVTSFSGNSTGLTPATATTGAISLAGILVGANGGTGVANTGKTFTIGGNFTTSGAFTTALTVTANTSLTLPISGTVLSSVTAPTANPITGTPSASNYLRGDGTWATFTTGTVTSVGFTGGLITVATPTTTPAFTVAGTSGGIPYFSSASTWATSAALALNSLVIGGGAGLSPATTTTGIGVLTALGTNVGAAGAFVTFNGALGTPSSGTVTNLTGTAAININGTVGATTANTGAFTTLTSTSDATIHGLTIGLGASAVATNFAAGYLALPANTTGFANLGIGYQSLRLNTTGFANLGIGLNTLLANLTGSYNIAIGYSVLSSATGSYNTSVGANALLNVNTGAVNTALGYVAGNAVTSGAQNILIGYNAGAAITTGSYNVVLGSYTGTAAPISVSGSNYVVLADGAGNIRTYYDASGNKVSYGVQATSAAAPTIASVATIAPTKAITFISGVTPIVTITAPSPISLGGGTITLIPTGIFTTTIAGNIALASTAVVGRALTMTYDVTTAKWYPSY